MRIINFKKINYILTKKNEKILTWFIDGFRVNLRNVSICF